MKFKKLLAAALSVLIAESQCVVPMENSGGLIPTASAATSSEEKSGTFGAEGNNLTWVLDSEGTLTISGNGAMDAWRYSSDVPWYSYRYDIVNVVIEDGVTTIGNGAFSCCDGLTSIIIPDSVTSIGDEAFWYCDALTSISLPDSLTSIGDRAFYYCRYLTSISLPDSLTSIGDSAFSCCIDLISIRIPAGVTSIGYQTFYNCDSLTSITIMNPECDIYYGSSSISNGTNYDTYEGTFYGTIYGYDYSTAYDYASIYNYKFVSLGEIPTTTTSTTTTTTTTSNAGVTFYGDSNMDGKINLADAVFIMQFKAEPDKYSISETGKLNADVYNKGNGITNMDALTIQKFMLGKISSLENVHNEPAPSVSDKTKGFIIKIFDQADSKYSGAGSKVIVSADDIAAGNITIPCGLYLDENTPDSQAMNVCLTVKDTSDDASKIILKSYNPLTGKYFSSPKTYTTYTGEDFTTDKAVCFASQIDDFGDYLPHGSWQVITDSKQAAYGTENYYIGCSWTCGGSDYTWTGTKSTDYPMFAFDVTLPRGLSAGTYKITFCNVDTDSSDNVIPSCMIENGSGYANYGDLNNLSLTELEIVVENAEDVLFGDANCDGYIDLSDAVFIMQCLANPSKYPISGAGMINADVCETGNRITAKDSLYITQYLLGLHHPDNIIAPSVKPSTPNPDGNPDFVIDFGSYTAIAGDKVVVKPTIKNNGSYFPVAGIYAEFAIDDPLAIIAIGGSSSACGGAAVISNPAQYKASITPIDGSGDPTVIINGAKLFQLMVEIPENCPAGTYEIGFGDKVDIFKEGASCDEWTYQEIKGIITVESPISIVKQPEDAIAASGEKAIVTVNATGDGLTYKWFYKNKAMTSFVESTSITSDTYTVEKMTSSRDGRQIYCVITDKYGNSVTTDTVTLTQK